MHLFLILMIAISLSMDAFSLALAYGTLNLSMKKVGILSAIVGIYHFFMPLLGFFMGSFILHFLDMDPDVLVFFVLLFLGISMLVETKKEVEVKETLNLFQCLLFGFAVSLDSFSVGIGLKAITNHYIITSCIFSFISFFFTYLGLFLGRKIHLWLGKISTIFGGIILILLGLLYLF